MPEPEVLRLSPRECLGTPVGIRRNAHAAVAWVGYIPTETLYGITAYMPQTTAQMHNQLLAALPLATRKRLLPHFERVELSIGMELYEPNRPLRHAYFPVDCIVSQTYELESGECAGTAVVGREGFVGVGLLLSEGTMANRAVVHHPGHAYRAEGPALKAAYRSRARSRDLFLRYALALLTQMSQVALCVRHHSTEQQLCRWLLLFIDRMQETGDVAGETVQQLLGGEDLPAALRRLKRHGAISCRRGRIGVLDRRRLEGLCCECYQVLRRDADSLLHHHPRLATG